MIYAIAAIASIAMVLISLKIWAAAKARPVAPPPRGLIFETNASRLDQYVIGAEEWWPHLRFMPLFWVGVLGTCIMLALAVHFGYVRGGHWGVIGVVIVASLFGIADLSIPFIALNDATDDGARSTTGTALLIIATVMSAMAIIGSTSEIATTTAARMDTGVISSRDSLKLLELKQTERDSIQVDRGAQALADLANATDEAANRESERKRCAEKCEKLKKEAADYRARQREAERKERLTGEIEALKVKLGGAGATEQRTDADAMATVISGMSGGLISRDGFRVYGLTVFGLVLVTLLTLLWTYIGSRLHDEIQWELRHRGEIADAQRRQLGLSLKYTATETPALLAAPRTSAQEQGLTFNVQAADMRKRYANDEDLLDTDSLFDRLMLKGEGGEVTIAALYRAYQIAVLTVDPNRRYMTQPTMASKLMIIAQNRDDVRVTADGIIQGWVLKPSDARKEVTNVP